LRLIDQTSLIPWYHAVCNVSEVDDALSTPPELKRIILEKLGHLVKAERGALAPVMSKYYDLFLYGRSGALPCIAKGFHGIKTEEALPIKKNPYNVPFALRTET